MAHTQRRSPDALGVEAQPVELAGIHARIECGLHVQRIGGGDLIRMRIQCVGKHCKQFISRLAIRPAKLLLGVGCSVGKRTDLLEDMRIQLVRLLLRACGPCRSLCCCGLRRHTLA